MDDIEHVMVEIDKDLKRGYQGQRRRNGNAAALVALLHQYDLAPAASDYVHHYRAMQASYRRGGFR